VRGLLALALVGCIEYQVADPATQVGTPNPSPVAQVERLDHIRQLDEPQVDVLWVVDNSCSMSPEQAALAEAFPQFMAHFVDSQVDWHVGVISTDMTRSDQKGRLQHAGGYPYIDTNTHEPIIVFTSMATMGTSGSGSEKTFDATYAALGEHRDGANAGFYRPEASLSVIAISDEDDDSHMPPEEFTPWLLNLKGDVDRVNFSAIVCLVDGYHNELPCSIFDVGEKYKYAAAATGGVAYEIREPNWDSVLDQLGIMALGPKQEFFLSDIPAPETIEVWVEIPDDEGKTVYTFGNGDYTYSETRNSITFVAYVPPQGASVFIQYTLLASHTQQTDTTK